MGKMKASRLSAFFVFAFFQLIYLTWDTMLDLCHFFLIALHFKHEFLLFLAASVVPPAFKVVLLWFGYPVMTAFTHNVCTLFCKSMVVDVDQCIIVVQVLYYESCFRHSMSLSELLLCFWTNSPWPKKKKLGNQMLLSSKKIVIYGLKK